MKQIYAHFAGALALTCTIAACAPAPVPTPAPAPAPAPTPTPVMTSAPVVQRTYENFLDAPQTAGDWSYRSDSTGSMASFGQGSSGARFALRCIPASRQISLMRAGQASGPVVMRILTETGPRSLTGMQDKDALPIIAVTLPASDPLLDAMAITKGRFAVETEGMETLYIPSWAEITRVIEDCRQ